MLVTRPMLDLVWEDHVKVSESCLPFSSLGTAWSQCILGNCLKVTGMKILPVLCTRSQLSVICYLQPPISCWKFSGKEPSHKPALMSITAKARHHLPPSPTSPLHHALETKRMAGVSQCSQLCKNHPFKNNFWAWISSQLLSENNALALK